MAGWQPDVYISISKDTAGHGWDVKRRKAHLLPPTSPPGGTREWQVPEFAPTAFALNATIPETDLLADDLPMLIQINDWLGVHPFSTAYCQGLDAAAAPEPAAAAADPRVAISVKPLYNAPAHPWAAWAAMHAAYHRCMGFHVYRMYTLRSNAHVFARNPALAALSREGYVELLEWPHVQWRKWLPEHHARHGGEILGVAQDTLFHTHGLLVSWHPHYSTRVIGLDLDEFIASTSGPSIPWSAFFGRYPQSVVQVFSSPFHCTEADPRVGLARLGSCSMRPKSAGLAEGFRMKAFLDTSRVLLTDQTHTGLGWQVTKQDYIMLDAEAGEVMLVHLRNVLAGRHRGGVYDVHDDRWLRLINVTCLDAWAPGWRTLRR